MAARAMWKASLVLGELHVPVKLFAAVRDFRVHFRLLDRAEHKPVEQRMVHPQTNEVVPHAAVQKGLLTEPGEYVVLRPEELEALAPKPSREIRVTRFVDPWVVSPEWYVRPYYLGPEGDAAPYFALAQALAAEGKEGIAHWTMRKSEYTGVLRAEGSYLMLMTLRHEDEVISASQLPTPEGRAYSDKEARMAEQLVSMFKERFDPTLFRDEYRERVHALVQAKAKGQAPRLAKPLAKGVEPSLESALARSLKKSRKEPSVA